MEGREIRVNARAMGAGIAYLTVRPMTPDSRTSTLTADTDRTPRCVCLVSYTG